MSVTLERILVDRWASALRRGQPAQVVLGRIERFVGQKMPPGDYTIDLDGGIARTERRR